jgi:hypothetical protein
MIVSTIENATVLVPNKEHKNFTETNEVIPISKTLVGEFKLISGLRRGKPFDYRIFTTDEGKVIYANTVSPQPKEFTTEPVKESSETKKIIISNKAILYTALGGAIGYVVSSQMNKEVNTKTALYVLGGAALGYLISKNFEPTTKTINN